MKQWSTATLPVPAQFEYWREVICQSFVPLRPERVVTNSQKKTFNCSLTTWEASDLLFAQVGGQSQWVHRDEHDISRDDRSVYFLNIQTKGQALIEQYGRQTSLIANSFALLDSTAPFRMQVSEHFEQLSIKIPKARLGPLLTDSAAVVAHRIDSQQGLGRLIVEAFQGIAREADYLAVPQIELAIEHALALTASAFNHAEPGLHPASGGPRLALASKDTTRYRIVRQRAVSYLRQHLDDPELNVQALAQAIGFSSRYIQAAFSVAHCSVGRWILDQRLELCRQDLLAHASTEALIATIAYRRGFNDLSYFNRAFKSKFKITPKQCRKH